LSLDGDTARQSIEIVRVGHAQDLSFVDARDAVTRMGESSGEVAVVREDQQPFGLEVESPNRIDVVAHTGQEIDHRRSPLWIRWGGDVAAWLVQEEIAMSLGQRNAPAIDTDVIAGRVRLRSELA